MTNTGFPRIANVGFTHMKPNLCPTCVHCVQGGGLVRAHGHTHICYSKGTILSAITTEKGRCADFAPSGDQRIPQSDVDAEIALLREFKASVAAHRANREDTP